METYCIVRRELSLALNGEVLAVRNIWDATPEGDEYSYDVLKEKARDLNRCADSETDYIICEGSFAKVLKSFQQVDEGVA